MRVDDIASNICRALNIGQLPRGGGGGARGHRVVVGEYYLPGPTTVNAYCELVVTIDEAVSLPPVTVTRLIHPPMCASKPATASSHVNVNGIGFTLLGVTGPKVAVE